MYMYQCTGTVHVHYVPDYSNLLNLKYILVYYTSLLCTYACLIYLNCTLGWLYNSLLEILFWEFLNRWWRGVWKYRQLIGSLVLSANLGFVVQQDQNSRGVPKVKQHWFYPDVFRVAGLVVYYTNVEAWRQCYGLH